MLTPAPAETPEQTCWAVAAGSRALVVALFDGHPSWLTRVQSLRAGPLNLCEDDFTLVVGDPTVEASEQAPVALAALVDYVKVMIDAYVAMCPEAASDLPVLDDTMIDRIFNNAK